MISKLATSQDMRKYDKWTSITDPQAYNKIFHRKLWEKGYICEILEEQGMLKEGKIGLGFGVGQDKLAPLFAKSGCKILATDLSTEEAVKDGWVNSGQHGANLESLFDINILSREEFNQRVSYHNVNMNEIPSDLSKGEFDFAWSCCSLEHVGSLDLAKQFIKNSFKCVKKGGIVIHTTEYNITSNTHTVESGSVVLFRKRDIEELYEWFAQQGFEAAELNLEITNNDIDNFVDLPPYKQQTHIRLKLGSYVITSIGLTIKK